MSGGAKRDSELSMSNLSNIEPIMAPSRRGMLIVQGETSLAKSIRQLQEHERSLLATSSKNLYLLPNPVKRSS
jgi:hypothetical protein